MELDKELENIKNNNINNDANLEDNEVKLKIMQESLDDMVYLNVGGKPFDTVKRTLCRYEDSFFAKMLSGRWENKKDREDRIFIDRNPFYFERILQFLRDPDHFNWTICLEKSEEGAFLNDVEFYGLSDAMFHSKQRSIQFFNFPDKINEDQNWLDPFFDCHPNYISVTLEDTKGDIVYEAHATIDYEYGYDDLTSTFAESGTFFDRPLILNNGDLLCISRKNWVGGPDWAFSLQDGYGIIIHPPDVIRSTIDNSCKKFRMLVLPYNLPSTKSPRAFTNWTMSSEITFVGANSTFSTYDSVPLPNGFIGKFTLSFNNGTQTNIHY